MSELSKLYSNRLLSDKWISEVDWMVKNKAISVSEINDQTSETDSVSMEVPCSKALLKAFLRAKDYRLMFMSDAVYLTDIAPSNYVVDLFNRLFLSALSNLLK